MNAFEYELEGGAQKAKIELKLSKMRKLAKEEDSAANNQTTPILKLLAMPLKLIIKKELCTVCEKELQQAQIKCPGTKCGVSFCFDCFGELDDKCPNCNTEYQVNDEEFSEEQDSSYEEYENLFIAR